MTGLMLANGQLLKRSLRRDRLALLGKSPEIVASELQAAESLDYQIVGGVAVIPIHGVVEYKLSIWGWLFGGTSCLGIQRAVRRAAGDSEVTRIVFDVDSPGGTYFGVPETAKVIFDARGEVDTVAIANPEAASAAVWLACAAARFTVYGSGWAGSIGVFIHLQSWAKFYEEAGIDNAIIRNPKYKLDENEYEELSDELKKHRQGIIDDVAAEFNAAVAKYRGVGVGQVRSEMGEGRMMMAAEAVSSGLCDATSTIEKEIARGNRRKPEVRTELSRVKRTAKLKGLLA